MASVSDIEQKLEEAQKSMREALLAFEDSETLKFHKIYDCLQELCSKQFKLEEKVLGIESHLSHFAFAPMMNNMMPMAPPKASTETESTDVETKSTGTEHSE